MRIGIKFAGQDPTQNISIKLQTPIKEWEVHDLVINPTPDIDDKVYRTYEDLETMYDKASARVKLSTKFNGQTRRFDTMQMLNTHHEKRMETVKKAMIEDMRKKQSEQEYPLMSKKKQDRIREFDEYKTSVLKSDDENDEKKRFVKPKKSSKRKSAPKRLSFEKSKFPDQIEDYSSQDVPSSESMVTTRSAKASKKSTKRKSNPADERSMKTRSSRRGKEIAPEISEESSEESIEEIELGHDSDYIESDQEKKSKRRKSNEATEPVEEKRVTRSRSKSFPQEDIDSEYEPDYEDEMYDDHDL
jgi:hypothetical protein